MQKLFQYSMKTKMLFDLIIGGVNVALFKSLSNIDTSNCRIKKKVSICLNIRTHHTSII